MDRASARLLDSPVDGQFDRASQQLLQGDRRRYAALVPLQHLGKQDALERCREGRETLFLLHVTSLHLRLQGCLHLADDYDSRS